MKNCLICNNPLDGDERVLCEKCLEERRKNEQRKMDEEISLKALARKVIGELLEENDRLSTLISENSNHPSLEELGEREEVFIYLLDLLR